MMQPAQNIVFRARDLNARGALSMLASMSPPRRFRHERSSPREAAHAVQRELISNAVDNAVGRLTLIGYAAVSVLFGERLPYELMRTYLSSDRKRSFDGTFVINEMRTDMLVETNPKISQGLNMQRQVVKHAFQHALDGRTRLMTPRGSNGPRISCGACERNARPVV